METLVSALIGCTNVIGHKCARVHFKAKVIGNSGTEIEELWNVAKSRISIQSAQGIGVSFMPQ